MAYDTLLHRLVANTHEPENERACWTWCGTTRRHGGGHRPALSMRVPGKPHPLQQNAARVMLEQFVGPLPPEHEASHLCADNWLCINPDHLVPETHSANCLRREGHNVPLPSLPREDDLGPWWVGKRGGKRCPF
jgi:hypothetical protein